MQNSAERAQRVHTRVETRLATLSLTEVNIRFLSALLAFYQIHDPSQNAHRVTSIK